MVTPQGRFNLQTYQKYRTNLYSIINSTTRKQCSAAFVGMVTLKDYIHSVTVRTTLCSALNTATGKYYSVAFIRTVALYIM